MRHCRALGLPDLQWTIARLHVLKDALTDLTHSAERSFAEFSYLLSEVLLEARNLIKVLEKKDFVIDSLAYRQVLAALKCEDDKQLNVNDNIYCNIAIPGTHFIPAKVTFFKVNKGNAIDHAANDFSNVDFNDLSSNLSKTFQILG